MLYEKKITERDQQSLKCFTVGIIDIICIENFFFNCKIRVKKGFYCCRFIFTICVPFWRGFPFKPSC